MKVGDLCVIVLRGTSDFENFFDGQYAEILEVKNETVKVQPTLIKNCTLELFHNEICVLNIISKGTIIEW